MKFFSLLTKANVIRQVAQNPKQIGREAVWGVIQGYLMIVAFWVTVPLVFSAILGFTNWFGGPFEFFEVIFYLLFLLLLAIMLTGYFVYRMLKKTWSEIKDKFARSHATEVDNSSSVTTSKF